MPEKAGKQGVNLFSTAPRRNVGWEPGEDRRVVLLYPRFTNRLAVKWFVPLLANPNVRVKLDEHGSLIWSLCDGKTTVGEIAERINETFGENFDPASDRLRKFVSRMLQYKFLILENSPSQGLSPGTEGTQPTDVSLP